MPQGDNGRQVGRLLIATSIICGSLAAWRVWSTENQHDNPKISSAEAKRMGYSSPSDWQRTQDTDAQLYKDQSLPGGWTDQDFDLFKAAVGNANEHARARVCMNAAFLFIPDQRRRALAILGTTRLSAADKVVWTFVIDHWLQDAKDTTIPTVLLTSENQDIAQLALAKAKDSASNSRIGSKLMQGAK
jgi:hypothetical protein